MTGSYKDCRYHVLSRKNVDYCRCSLIVSRQVEMSHSDISTMSYQDQIKQQAQDVYAKYARYCTHYA